MNVYAVHIGFKELVVMVSKPWLFALTFLAFPPAGLLARAVVGPVDSVTAGLVGGAIVGLVVGAAQWLVLRAVVSAWWIAATTAAVGIGLGLTAGLGLVSTDRSDLLVIGVVTGVLVGAAQALLLPARLRVAWGVAVAVLWPLAWQVTALVGVDLTQGWAVFGASGAVVYAASLAGVLALVGRRVPAEVTA